MKRRTLLAALGTVGTVALAGCADGSNGPGTETPTVTLSREGACPSEDAGSASIDFGDTTVTVDGCLTARDGCHYPELADAGYEETTFRIVVEEVDESDPYEACTQAIEYRAYSVEAVFDGDAPETVEVVHDAVEGRETVATAERD